MQVSEEMPFRILDLPPELIVLILRSLDWRSILQCLATCKTLQGLTQTAEVRYQLELAYDGLLPTPSWTSVPFHAALAALRTRREAFRYLQWKNTVNVSIPGPCQAYELVGGVFAKSMPAGGLMLAPGSRHFLFSWLPTSKGPLGFPRGSLDNGGHCSDPDYHPSTSTLVRPDIGIATRDFAIDPTQDLIALIEHDDGPTLTSPHALVQIHLRTISTNEPHPETTCPIFRHVTPFRIGNAFIQIVDDVVGLFFWAEGPGLLIWSWKDGRVCVYQTEPELSPSAWDFAFLSPRAYMMTYTGSPGSIEVFTFTVGDEMLSAPGPVITDNAAGLNSYHVNEGSTSADTRGSGPLTTPTHIAQLQLPPLQPTVPLVNFSTHTGPYLANPPRTSVPFYTDTYNQRMHVTTMRYHADNRVFRYIMYVNNKTFLDLVKKRKEEWGPTGKKVLSWSEWGREATRITASLWEFHWLRYVYGTRVVCPPERVPDGNLPNAGLVQRIRLLDFNVRAYLPRPSYLDGDEQLGEAGPAPRVSSQSDSDPNGVSSPPAPYIPAPTRTVESEMNSYISEEPAELNGDVIETSLNLEPSQVVCDAVFKDPVETTLPYRTVTRTMRVPPGGLGSGHWGYSGFMIDEERLIGLKGDMGDVTVFTL